MSDPGVGRRTRVMVIFGGRSAEHDVSRVTAVAVAKALDPERYDVIPVAIGTDGQWHAADDAAALLAAGRELLPAAFAGLPAASVKDSAEVIEPSSSACRSAL